MNEREDSVGGAADTEIIYQKIASASKLMIRADTQSKILDGNKIPTKINALGKLLKCGEKENKSD